MRHTMTLGPFSWIGRICYVCLGDDELQLIQVTLDNERSFSFVLIGRICYVRLGDVAAHSSHT